jgi:hypothetical protein
MTEALQDYLNKSKEIRKAIVQNARRLYEDQQISTKPKSLTPRASRNTERGESGKISIIIKQILETESSQAAQTHNLFSINELPPDKLRTENKPGTRLDSSSNKPIKLPYIRINHPKRIVSRTKLRPRQNECMNSSVEISSTSQTSDQESMNMKSKLNKSFDLSGSKGSKSNNIHIKPGYEVTESRESTQFSNNDKVSKSYNSISPSSISENEEHRCSSKNGYYLPSLRERLRRDYGVAPVIHRKIKPAEVNNSTLLTYQRAIRREKAVSANETISSRHEIDCINLSSVISKRSPSVKPDSSELQL